MRKGIGGHHRAYRGASDIWLTPPEIVASLGPFDLDPCAAPHPRPWNTASHHYCLDGLNRPWDGRVWLNPPYGPQLGKWLERLADHGNGIAIAFARTETQAFQKFVWPRANAILFFYGRLHFHRPDGSRAKANAGGPSCLIAYGSHNTASLYLMASRGIVIELNRGMEVAA